MGWVFSRRRKVGDGLQLNLGKSGASMSKRKGPLTVNSRGRATVRLGKGISFRL